MLNREEIEKRVRRFSEFMRREQELRDEIMTLQLYGSRDKSAQSTARHDEILEEIEKNRYENMMPILEELMAFIAECEKLEREGKLKKRAR